MSLINSLLSAPDNQVSPVLKSQIRSCKKVTLATVSGWIHQATSQKLVSATAMRLLVALELDLKETLSGNVS